jgi:hypothetical protein
MLEEFIKGFGPPICTGLGFIQIPILIENPLAHFAWFALGFSFAMSVVLLKGSSE